MASSVVDLIVQRFNFYKKQRFFRFGIPFLLFMIGGSFGLKGFTDLRYKFSNKKQVTREELEKMGISFKSKEEVSLEAVYEQIKEIDIDNWTNIRGPRPWEEPTETSANKSKV